MAHLNSVLHNPASPIRVAGYGVFHTLRILFGIAGCAAFVFGAPFILLVLF